MLKGNQVDAKAIKMLLKYDMLANLYEENSKIPLTVRQKKYLDENRNSPEDFIYMKSHGVAFDPIETTHDLAVDKCFEYHDLCRKKEVTDLFLAGLSNNRPDYRSGLPAYAIMYTMPRHSYKENAANNCQICAAKKARNVDLTSLNQERFKFGSMIASITPFEIEFFLQQHLLLSSEEPIAADFDIFNTILDFLRNADMNCKPKDLQKKLRNVPKFQATADQCRYFLEALGFCSILETTEHKGYLTKYTNPGLAPHKTHSSDWAYPVDFWTGADGVNDSALKFWFGDYKEINI